LRKHFPDLTVLVVEIDRVAVAKSTSELEVFKKYVTEETEQNYSLESIKDNAIFRTY